MSDGMRFGLFLPQGWRLDLAGIKAADQWRAPDMGWRERKTLRIAAKYAQYTNFAGILANFRHKSEVLAEHCREIGTDFGAITRSANYNVVIGKTQAEVDDRFARLDLHSRLIPHGRPEDDLKAYRRSPTVGTPEQVIEALRALNDAGMTYAICYFPQAVTDPSGVELFQREVMPALT